MSIFSFELEFASKVVLESSKITEWFKNKHIKSYKKQDDSPVTLADLASQIYIISQIRKKFPEDHIVAEEENIDLIDNENRDMILHCFDELSMKITNNLIELLKYKGSSSKRTWTIDPIDGTLGYEKKLWYAIGLGLMISNEPQVSAISVPNYNSIETAVFRAIKGYGAEMSYDNRSYSKIHVSNSSDLSKFRLYHSLHYDEPWVMEFASKNKVKNHKQIDSMAKFCKVADGTADLYIKPLREDFSFSWDYVPGDLLVREAGGMVTYLNGDNLEYKGKLCLVKSPGYVVSNGILHNEVLMRIEEIRELN